MSDAAPFRPAIVLFGDSITQYSFGSGGWGATIADLYARKADVICRGFSGYSSRMARCLLPHCFPDGFAAHVATVFFGANDAVSAEKGPAQHVPIEEYRNNIAAIVQHLAGQCRLVVVLSAPPVDAARWDGRCNAAVRDYSRACAQAVADVQDTIRDAPPGVSSAGTAVLHVDLYTAMGGPVPSGGSDDAASASWQRHLSDGLHLSPEGSRLVAESVMAAIASAAPRLLPAALPWDAPLWRDVDNTSAATVAGALDSRSLAALRSAEVPKLAP